MEKFKNKKSKANIKFSLLATSISLGLFFGGTVLNICQGKYSSKLNAAEQKEGVVAPLTPGFKDAMERSFQQGAEWPDKLMVNNVSMKVEYNFNENLTNYAKTLLKQYRSDYTTLTHLLA